MHIANSPTAVCQLQRVVSKQNFCSKTSRRRSALHLAAHPAPEYHRDDRLLHRHRQPSLHFHTPLTLHSDTNRPPRYTHALPSS
ncbi:hypothetical protein NQZ68_004697 [Dissostichus eleginoides]|nr:hypothetical protein NQZ68_004697 [Dissostichus eleginoides]